MRMPIAFRLSLALGVCLIVVGTVTVVGQETRSRGSDLTGEWVLNRDLSADPRQSEEGRRGGERGGGPEGRGGPGGGRRGGSGGGMRGGFSGESGRGTGGDDSKMREQMEEAQRLIRDAPTSMVLTYNEPKLAMAAADGRTRTLYADKRQVKTANGNADLEAQWDGKKLVAETTFGSIKVVETYAVVESGHQLVVTVKMDAPGGGRGGRPNPELRRVYDRVNSVDEPAK